MMLALELLVSLAHGQGRRKKFFEVATLGKYQPGAYTLADGSRHPGTLRLWQDTSRTVVQVDQGKAIDPLNLELAGLRGLRIGLDSFIVARQVPLAGTPAARPLGKIALLKVVLRGNTQVFEHEQLLATTSYFIGAGGKVYGSGNDGGYVHVHTWVVRPRPQAELVAIPEGREEFARHVAGLFVEYPALCQRIRAGLEGPDDFKRIIYAYAFRQNISDVSFERAATIFP
jgi:hypothetical protein